MRVTRINGNSNHYWNIVNPDEGGWYHFDTTPLAKIHPDTFMFTDSQAAEYTERIKEATGAVNYYTYDADLYPEIVQ